MNLKKERTETKLLAERWCQFVSGDQAGFQGLFNSSYQGLYGYGLKLCSDPELVEDAIQDLFVTLWERRCELTHVVSPHVYLFVSLRRNILKQKRVLERQRELPPEEVNGFNVHFTPDELIILGEMAREQKVALTQALNQLSNQQKEVLYLHFYNGMSYDEIEEILSINRQSVRNHMYRAMETLRSVLKIDSMRLIKTSGSV